MHPHLERFGVRVRGWWRPISTRREGATKRRWPAWKRAAVALLVAGGLAPLPPPISGGAPSVPYVFSSTTGTGTAVSNGLTINTPSCNVGDTLIAATCISNFNAAPSITLPAGWNNLGGANGLGVVQRAGINLSVRVANATDAAGGSYTWSTTQSQSGTPYIGAIYCIRGGRGGTVKIGYILDGTVPTSYIVGGNGTDSTAECGALTTGYANSMVLLVSGAAQSGVALSALTATPATGFTEQTDLGAVNGTGTITGNIAVDTKVQSAAGTTGTNTITWSGAPAAGSWASLTLLIAAPQPIVSVVLDSGTISADQASYTTLNSVTLKANTLYTLAVYNARASAVATPTSVTNDTGGATWSIGDAAGNNGNVTTGGTGRETMWRYSGTTDVTTTVTVAYATTQVRFIYSLVEHRGAKWGGTNGSAGIVQMKTASGANSNPTLTLSAFASARNATYGAAYGAGAVTFTPGTGLYELTDQAVESNDMCDDWIDKEQDVVGMTISSATVNWGEIAMEIAVAGKNFGGGVTSYEEQSSPDELQMASVVG